MDHFVELAEIHSLQGLCFRNSDFTTFYSIAIFWVGPWQAVLFNRTP